MTACAMRQRRSATRPARVRTSGGPGRYGGHATCTSADPRRARIVGKPSGNQRASVTKACRSPAGDPAAITTRSGSIVRRYASGARPDSISAVDRDAGVRSKTGLRPDPALEIAHCRPGLPCGLVAVCQVGGAMRTGDVVGDVDQYRIRHERRVGGRSRSNARHGIGGGRLSAAFAFVVVIVVIVAAEPPHRLDGDRNRRVVGQDHERAQRAVGTVAGAMAELECGNHDAVPGGRACGHRAGTRDTSRPAGTTGQETAGGGVSCTMLVSASRAPPGRPCCPVDSSIEIERVAGSYCERSRRSVGSVTTPATAACSGTPRGSTRREPGLPPPVRRSRRWRAGAAGAPTPGRSRSAGPPRLGRSALPSTRHMRSTTGGGASSTVPSPCVTTWRGTSSCRSSKNLALSSRVARVSVLRRVRDDSDEPGSLKPMWPSAPIPSS